MLEMNVKNHWIPYFKISLISRRTKRYNKAAETTPIRRGNNTTHQIQKMNPAIFRRIRAIPKKIRILIIIFIVSPRKVNRLKDKLLEELESTPLRLQGRSTSPHLGYQEALFHSCRIILQPSQKVHNL